MIISPFSPIFFDDFKSDGIESRYVQLFAPSDRILLECLCSPDEAFGLLIDGTTDNGIEVREQLKHSSWTLADGTELRFAVITGLNPGYYRFHILPTGQCSHYFRITDNRAELAGTTLIQYSMKDNRQRQDAVFIIDGMRYFFDFRVPGGFKDSGWTFSVENEQFITSEADPVELFALESTQRRFTMGGQAGVPVYFAELLNRLLTCTYVYFDGVRYARKDSSVPEMTVQVEGLDSFVFSQLLQKVNNLNPAIENANHLIMRRVDDTLYRSSRLSEDTVTNRIIY